MFLCLIREELRKTTKNIKKKNRYFKKNFTVIKKHLPCTEYEKKRAIRKCLLRVLKKINTWISIAGDLRCFAHEFTWPPLYNMSNIIHEKHEEKANNIFRLFELKLLIYKEPLNEWIFFKNFFFFALSAAYCSDFSYVPVRVFIG